MARRLADVAKYAGVHEATVSRVLNSKPGMSEATRERVLSALDVLGYERPTQLRRESARLVALMLPELQNPTYPVYAEVAADALAKRGFSPVLCTRTTAGVSEASYVDMMLERHVSGFIFFGGQCHEADAEHEHYHRLRERGVPAVLVNAACEGLGFPRVVVDDAHAIDLALRHLRSLGHECIGITLGPHDHVPSARKLSAWHDRGQTDPDLVERTTFSLTGGEAAGKRLLRRGATGIICASDMLALGVIRVARRQGLEVPDDVSVIGFDGSLFTSFTDPPLTTVRIPIEEIAQAAVTLLAGAINSPIALSNDDESLFEPELVVRRSTGPPPQQPDSAPLKTSRHAVT